MKIFGMIAVFGLMALGGSAFAAENRGVLTCDVAGAEAGLEDLTLTRGAYPGQYRLSVTVSGPGDFMETYNYTMTRTDEGYESTEPGQAELKLAHPSATRSSGKLIARGPRTAQIWPDSRFEYPVVCKSVN